MSQAVQFGIRNVVQRRRRPRPEDRSVNQTLVLIWNSEE